ncbi:hypothetical protein CBR_g19138 [Chara braunii]|uniref:Uncharacterized protein n=1 Tax=Chara braunii TaxID=69332 RepID=A0A388KXM7_CHABU|nr:hypothetical protein CBR_g19138 [Chara braunii]|eukprot:GBG74732.1 hypothetical protein CBR_g19138 [Chara braunii]
MPNPGGRRGDTGYRKGKDHGSKSKKSPTGGEKATGTEKEREGKKDTRSKSKGKKGENRWKEKGTSRLRRGNGDETEGSGRASFNDLTSESESDSAGSGEGKLERRAARALMKAKSKTRSKHVKKIRKDDASFSDHGEDGREGNKGSEGKGTSAEGGQSGGLLGGVPMETLGRGEADTPRFLVPLICANSSKGVKILAIQLASGSMELPTIEANESLTESVILKKTKAIIPSCVQCRVIQCLRTGVHTISTESGKVRFLFAFLNAKMDNSIKEKLEGLGWDWFSLEILDSDLNEELDFIRMKGATAKLIAEWLNDAEVHRGILFDGSLAGILQAPWLSENVALQNQDGARRRKQSDLNSASGGRIHGNDGLLGSNGEQR